MKSYFKSFNFVSSMMLAVVALCIFVFCAVSIYNKEKNRQINLEHDLKARYEACAEVVGAFDLSGYQVFVFKMGGHEYLAIKGYGITEIDTHGVNMHLVEGINK